MHERVKIQHIVKDETSGFQLFCLLTSYKKQCEVYIYIYINIYILNLLWRMYAVPYTTNTVFVNFIFFKLYIIICLYLILFTVI